MTVALAGLDVGDSPQSWATAGFEVRGCDGSAAADAVCAVGSVDIRLLDRGSGIVGWSLSGLTQSGLKQSGLKQSGLKQSGLARDGAPPEIDGVPTSQSAATARSVATHPNGVTAIDHVVLMSPNLDRTVRALSAIGSEPRRVRDAELGGRDIRQVFFRFGEVIVEVVGVPGATGDGPSSLWGITFTVADIDATAAFFGDRTAPVKDAVQPGRRITTLRHRALGMSVRTAFISASR